MSLISAASNASAWRGYEYHIEKRVQSCKQVSESEFEGDVKGTDPTPYHVLINVDHPRKSHCNCPLADGKQIICKHMVALLFTAIPKEVDIYMAEIEESERQEEQRAQDRYKELEKYVKSLSKAELRESLLNILVEQEDRNRNY